MSTTPEQFNAYLGESEQARLAVLELLMDTIPTGVWYRNTDGDVIYVNERFASITGLTFEDVRGKGYLGIVHPDDLDILVSAIEDAVATHSGYDVSFRARNSVDSEYRWLSCRAHWTPKHNGFPEGLIGIVFDTGERYRTSTEASMLWKCVEQVNHPIVVTRADKEDNPIVYINHAFTERTGYVLEDVDGRNPRFLHKGDDDQPILSVISDTIKSGKPISNVIVRNYTKSGAMYFAELHLSPVYVGKELVYWIGFQLPVTERVRLHEVEELRAVVDRLLNFKAHCAGC